MDGCTAILCFTEISSDEFEIVTEPCAYKNEISDVKDQNSSKKKWWNKPLKPCKWWFSIKII